MKKRNQCFTDFSEAVVFLNGCTEHPRFKVTEKLNNQGTCKMWRGENIRKDEKRSRLVRRCKSIRKDEKRSRLVRRCKSIRKDFWMNSQNRKKWILYLKWVVWIGFSHSTDLFMKPLKKGIKSEITTENFLFNSWWLFSSSFVFWRWNWRKNFINFLCDVQGCISRWLVVSSWRNAWTSTRSCWSRWRTSRNVKRTRECWSSSWFPLSRGKSSWRRRPIIATSS